MTSAWPTATQSPHDFRSAAIAAPGAEGGRHPGAGDHGATCWGSATDDIRDLGFALPADDRGARREKREMQANGNAGKKAAKRPPKSCTGRNRISLRVNNTSLSVKTLGIGN
jgi:hypothetical protein